MAKKKKKKPHKPEAPKFNGDHGTGTKAALAGTILEEIEGEAHNRMARRRRVNRIAEMRGLSMRQQQAAEAIQNAYCRVEMLSSGSPLKERVQASPKPDVTIAMQADAQSILVSVMAPVPSAMRYVVEHVCWYNRPITELGPSDIRGNHYANFKVAMDLVANRLRY